MPNNSTKKYTCNDCGCVYKDGRVYPSEGPWCDGCQEALVQQSNDDATKGFTIKKTEQKTKKNSTMTNSLNIKQFKSPEEAPNYKEQEEEFKGLDLKEACIVRNGTQGGRSTVDLVLEDEEGNKHVAMITGRLLRSLSSIVGNEG